MKKLTFTIASSLMVCMQGMAQDRSITYTNLLNPFVTNAAVAGSNQQISAVLNTRGVAGGPDGTWRSYNFGIHAPLKNGNGVGVKLLSNAAGVFQTFNAEGVYSKQVKINSKNTFSLGLSAGLVQTNLKSELLNSMVDKSDAYLSNPDLNRLRFSSGAGMLYQYNKKAELGISFPALISGDDPINNLMVINAAYNIYAGKNKQVKIKPMANYYNLPVSPSMYDGLVAVSFKDAISITGGYRSNGSAIVGAGINFKSFAISYAHYQFTGATENLNPAENEICISFGFNKADKTTQANTDQLVQDEIDRISGRLNELMAAEKNNQGVLDMKKELQKLNKDLVKVLGRYKITNPEQIQKIRSLQGNIESIIARYND